MRYYSTRRPITKGSYPQLESNKIKEIHNFDGKTYCEDIKQEAWGYIEYEQPLQPEDISDYELTSPPRKILTLEFIGMDSWDRAVFEDENGYLWKYTEPGDLPYERHDRLYSANNNEFDGEPCWPMLPDIDYQFDSGTENAPHNE